jgi:AraC-like DNA-binding protein
VVFFEKLYPHDHSLSPLLFMLNFLVAHGAGTPGYFTEQFVVLLEKMLQAHRGISAEIAKLPAFRFSTRVEIYRRLHRAKDFIDSCYQQPIQLPQIARIAQLSRYHFLRLFKAAFNETPYQYLTRRRLETARTLLATTDIPITQICYEAGFEDLSAFGRLFRQFSGLSPKAFRRDRARLN